MRARTLVTIGVVLGFWLGSAAHALPSLQLGPGGTNWSYVNGTWVTTDNPLNLLAFADATTAQGGTGAYAWSPTDTNRYAYLVVSAVPMTGETEPPSIFDITIQNDGVDLALYAFGNGTPLAPHSIFPTYFEIYEFSFDGGLTGIYNTQTGLDPAMGFAESLDITIHSLGDGTTQLHFDLFTVNSTGQLNPSATPSRRVVNQFAPFTHDAQAIPEPGAVGIFSISLLVAGVLIARSRRATEG